MMNSFTLSFFYFIIFGYQVYAVPYDYSFTNECLAKPLAPQYNGGIVVNSELNEGLNRWTAHGNANVEHVTSEHGNKYIVASNRQQPFHSFLQKFELEKDNLYSFSAWLQVNFGIANVEATFKTPNGYQIAGRVNAQNGCWSMLKGGFVADASGPAQLYFESENVDVDIWVDSISLQPFTLEEWQSHHNESIHKVRKRNVKFQVRNPKGRSIQNATVLIKPKRSNFPLGCAINGNILDNPPYQNWFFSRFKYTVFENELKWYSTENTRGKEDYSKSDALIKLAKSHGVSIRGHNLLWDDPKFQPSWVGTLEKDDLSTVTTKRINSVMSRYHGQFVHWDILNENLHFDFFESKLGGDIAATFFRTANRIDRGTVPFLNDYNTIEDNRDSKSSPSKYLEKIKQVRSGGYNGPLGIGLEGHFSIAPNVAYMRSVLDQLSSAKLPIWITELDVASGPNQATYLDQILRELHAHPVIRGIMIWSAWSPEGCYRMCLTDNKFKNLQTGDVVDKFRTQSLLMNEFQLRSDSNGFVETSLLHGEYEVAANYPHGDQVSTMHKFDITQDAVMSDVIHLKIEV